MLELKPKAALVPRLGVGLAALLLLAPLVASAEEPRPAPKAEDAAAAPVEVIFTGFARRSDKGASVFVRMTGEVPVAMEQNGHRLVYHLSGAKLGVRNNANPLPTGQFGPPVSSVALVQGNGTVDVVIDLSGDSGGKQPSHRVVTSSGIATLVVTLPPAEADGQRTASR
jgi:hypothetical protein